MTTIKYVAFLRGINSGKNQTIKMDALRKTFEDLGFENVKTVIASGNVIFQAPTMDKTKLEQKIEKALPEAIGFESDTIVVPIEELEKLIAKNPFKAIPLSPHIKPYLTFVKDPWTRMKLPVEGKGYTILGIVDDVVCSIVDLSIARTPDLMKVLDKGWKANTTRGWATVAKIVKEV